MSAIMIQRKDDMSSDGTLTLCYDLTDGDIGLTIVDAERGSLASIEFCSALGGGGRSPRTLKALKSLVVAMALDEADPDCSGRSGRDYGEGNAIRISKLLNNTIRK